MQLGLDRWGAIERVAGRAAEGAARQASLSLSSVLDRLNPRVAMAALQQVPAVTGAAVDALSGAANLGSAAIGASSGAEANLHESVLLAIDADARVIADPASTPEERQAARNHIDAIVDVESRDKESHRSHDERIVSRVAAVAALCVLASFAVLGVRVSSRVPAGA